MLEVLLSRYLDILLRDQFSLALTANRTRPHNPKVYPFNFNLAHSDGLALYALTRVRDGIDLERIRRIPGEISRNGFFQLMKSLANELPSESRNQLFLTADRKEAFIKAIGIDCIALMI